MGGIELMLVLEAIVKARDQNRTINIVSSLMANCGT